MAIDSIISTLKISDKIAVTFHQSPDGDALGSAIALVLGLRSMGKEAYIATRDLIDDTYKFLPLMDEIKDSCYEIKNNTQCLVVLDCGNIERISAKVDINNLNYKVINIDHHLSNDMYADINYVDTHSAATAEIVYKILKLLDININSEIATCLYTSIVTDTGSFKYSNTTNTTHSIAGELIGVGIDFPNIHRSIFENKPFEKLKLYGKVLNEMKLYNNEKSCILSLPRSITSELGDTSDIIALQMQIDSIEVAALLKDVEDGVKISLRSKNTLDVRNIAEKFRGGGHERAAGFLLKDVSLNEARDILINIFEKELI